MAKLDPDSFGGKLVLNGVDKLVFTLLLLVALAVWTDRQREFERASMRVEKLTGIEIERPIALVERLAGPIRRCKLFLRLNRIRGIDSDDLRAELQSHLVEIELHADVIENYTEDSKEETSGAAKRLGEIVRAFGLEVMTAESVSLEQYDTFEHQLDAQFDLLFKSTIRETVEATRQGED